MGSDPPVDHTERVTAPKLRDNLDDLFALTGKASTHFSLPPEIVEMDFWMVELLRSVSQPVEDAHLIFKGGTSLSKAYGLIHRFSQDIDILVEITRQRSKSFGKVSIDKILKDVCQRVSTNLGLKDGLDKGSTRGEHRNIWYSYPHRTGPEALQPGILLEIGLRGAIGDLGRHSIVSYIAQYATNQLPEKERRFEEFSPVEIDVLDPVWTLTEKLCALHNFSNSYVADSEEIRRRFSTIGRHYYDVHAILSSEDIVTRLNHSPNLVEDIEAQVAEGTRPWKDLEHTPRPAEGFARSPAFDSKHPCMEIARPSYKRLATLMLMGYPLPPFDNCLRMIQDHAKLL